MFLNTSFIQIYLTCKITNLIPWLHAYTYFVLFSKIILSSLFCPPKWLSLFCFLATYTDMFCIFLQNNYSLFLLLPRMTLSFPVTTTDNGNFIFLTGHPIAFLLSHVGNLTTLSILYLSGLQIAAHLPHSKWAGLYFSPSLSFCIHICSISNAYVYNAHNTYIYKTSNTPIYNASLLPTHPQ